METIGIRVLKENLSRYMKQVKSGETIIITDRKKEIAAIMPFEKAMVVAISGKKISEVLFGGLF
ncbi:MAG: type II toxin-antitoxin system prevent-host-death family antitoxin [Nitrospiraceae bacterium]|nr:type II toxin-antitoxin system prevent-host-death family antitoxin [Nitrospiraceae bacterium]